jgi:hypothetical protein
MKRAATLLVVLAVMGCATQSQESIFPPDTSADAAACREEAMRDRKNCAMRAGSAGMICAIISSLAFPCRALIPSRAG